MKPLKKGSKAAKAYMAKLRAMQKGKPRRKNPHYFKASEHDALANEIRIWWIAPGKQESFTGRFQGTFAQALERAAESSAMYKSKVHIYEDRSGQPVAPGGKLPAPIDYFGALWATVSVVAESPLRGGPMSPPFRGIYKNPRRRVQVFAHNAKARAIIAKMNPLTVKEANELLADATRDAEGAVHYPRQSASRGFSAGSAMGQARAVRAYGPSETFYPAEDTMRRAYAAVRSNPLECKACKGKGIRHPYTVCGRCKCQYCSKYWDSKGGCPRCQEIRRTSSPNPAPSFVVIDTRDGTVVYSKAATGTGDAALREASLQAQRFADIHKRDFWVFLNMARNVKRGSKLSLPMVQVQGISEVAHPSNPCGGRRNPAICDGCNEKDPSVRHYSDTKSFLCKKCRVEFLRTMRFDDKRGDWIPREGQTNPRPRFPKKYALVPSERSKPCPHTHMPYTGTIPCTGVRRCTMCGATEAQIKGRRNPVFPADVKMVAETVLALPHSVNWSAKPYAEAIVQDFAGADDPKSVVAYLKSNLRNWRGPQAQAAKVVLDRFLSGKPYDASYAIRIATAMPAAPRPRTPRAPIVRKPPGAYGRPLRTANTILSELEAALSKHETGEHIDYMVEELFQWVQRGWPEPVWFKYPLAKSYYDSRVAGAKRKGLANPMRKLRTPTSRDVDAIAREFSRLLWKQIGVKNMMEVNRRNRTGDPNACSTHDFLDANMVMDRAFRNLGLQPDPEKSPAAHDYWGIAWTKAKKAEFYPRLFARVAPGRSYYASSGRCPHCDADVVRDRYFQSSGRCPKCDRDVLGNPRFQARYLSPEMEVRTGMVRAHGVKSALRKAEQRAEKLPPRFTAPGSSVEIYKANPGLAPVVAVPVPLEAGNIAKWLRAEGVPAQVDPYRGQWGVMVPRAKMAAAKRALGKVLANPLYRVRGVMTSPSGAHDFHEIIVDAREGAQAKKKAVQYARGAYGGPFRVMGVRRDQSLDTIKRRFPYLKTIDKTNPSRRALLGEARELLRDARADVKAGHKGAAEYWKGKASGLAQAALSNPKGSRIEIHSGPDAMGRYRYTMFWMAKYHPGDPRGEHRWAERAQEFHAPLPEWFKKTSAVRRNPATYTFPGYGRIIVSFVGSRAAAEDFAGNFGDSVAAVSEIPAPHRPKGWGADEWFSYRATTGLPHARRLYGRPSGVRGVRPNPLLQMVTLANPGKRRITPSRRFYSPTLNYFVMVENKDKKSWTMVSDHATPEEAFAQEGSLRVQGLNAVATDRFGTPLRKSNPGRGITRPASCPFREGQKVSIAQARAWAQKSGNRTLLGQIDDVCKLQKKANRPGSYFIWKTIPVGDPKKLEMVTAMAQYGTTDETLYKPPKGSKKGQHLYSHKWGEGSGSKKPVPLLAAHTGKALIMPLRAGQKAGDWLRG